MSIPGGGRSLAHSRLDIAFESGERASFRREIKIVGYCDVEEDWRRFEVRYSSLWIGMKTHASWKKGFLEVAVVERRRD
jgi:hypothetical protein